jgi:hypothetical protein
MSQAGPRQGKKNVYMCDCGHAFVSIDRDTGVTPFMVKCRQPDCGMLAKSWFYRVPEPLIASVSPVIEWYSPDEAERRTLSPAAMDHVEKGGLLQRDCAREKRARCR